MNLELNVGDALKQPGKAFLAILEEAVKPQCYGGRQIEFLTPVQLELTYSYDGGALTLSGRLSMMLSSRCARCDELFAEEFDIPFSERFVKGASSDDGSYVFEGEKLELITAVMDNIFLNLPIISVCNETCKGLCPVCGCNLNLNTCTCNQGED